MRTLILLSVLWSQILAQSKQTLMFPNQIKLSPVGVITGVRGLQVSYERQFAGKFSSQVFASWLFDPLAHSHYATWDNLKGFALGVEQKYFFKSRKLCKHYISVDLDVLTCHFQRTAAFKYLAQADSVSFVDDYTDTIGIQRKTATLSLRYGVQVYINRFVLDLYVGLGCRYRSVTHTDKLREDVVLWKPLEPNLSYALTVEGKYYTFNVPVGLKIGYRF